MRALVTVIAGLLTLSASAQKLVIGEVQASVRAEFNTRPEFYSVPYDKIFPNSDEAFVAAAGGYGDVWEVVAKGNTFQMRAFYTPDTDLSRLHPTQRLHGVVFIPDKRQSGRDMLQEIPMMRILCESGCGVMAFRSNVVSNLALHVCENRASAAAAGSATAWNDDPDPRASYRVCAEISYGEYPETARVKDLSQIPWKSLEVDRIAVQGEDINSLFKLGTLQVIGTWKPS